MNLIRISIKIRFFPCQFLLWKTSNGIFKKNLRFSVFSSFQFFYLLNGASYCTGLYHNKQTFCASSSIPPKYERRRLHHPDCIIGLSGSRRSSAAVEVGVGVDSEDGIHILIIDHLSLYEYECH